MPLVPFEYIFTSLIYLLYLVRLNGTSFWCQVTSVRIPDGEEELGYMLLEDISDLKAGEHRKVWSSTQSPLRQQ